MILVTGATGFVGSALVRRLVTEGADVRVLRRASSSLDLLGDVDVEHAVGDVTDPDTVWAAMNGVEVVYHVAAVVAFGRRARERLRRVNVEGTAHVVDAANAASVRRLVHTSSIAALGRPERPGGDLDETAVWTRSTANTDYARSKHDAEREVQRAVAEGLDAVIVNPALVWGPGRSGEGTFALAERIAASRMPLAPPGATGVVDVEDVAAGLCLACAHGATGERYVLSGASLPWLEIVDTLAHATGARPPRGTAPSWALGMLGALAEAGALATRSDPAVTRATARSASAAYRYDGTKATRDLGLHYRPFTETAARIAMALNVAPAP